jgi:vitellogenic carboxypeptidase-like protein
MYKRSLILACTCYIILYTLAERVTHLPGYGEVTEDWFSGYKNVTSQNGKSGGIFYWFFEGPKDAPVVVWLNGGPGCSSLIGLFAELGPLKIQEDCFTVTKNPNGWNKIAHMLFIDQPIGTGYSFANGKEHFTENQEEIVDHLHSALSQFFKDHPEYDNDLYLAGESYAGKFIPSLAERIIKTGQVGKGKLKGIILGDGLVDPIIQRSMKHEQAFWNGLISIKQRKQLQTLQGKCVRHIQMGNTNQLDSPCDDLKSVMLLYSGIINVYDLRRFDPSTNKTRIEIYLNRPEVREALHAKKGTKDRYTTCSKTVVYMHLKYDILLSVKHLIPFLTQHIRVNLYNGNFDLQDGPIGTEQFLHTLDIPGFNDARRDLWFVDNEMAGYSQSVGNLTFVIVHGAGHFVPTDRPRAALAMLENFINVQPFCDYRSIPITHSSLTPAEFDKYLEQDKQTNKTLLPCNIQAVGCRMLCQNGECIDGSCVCKPNWAGEDCSAAVSSLQRNSRAMLLPQEWRYYKFRGKDVAKRTLLLDIKIDNTTEKVDDDMHFVGEGFGTDMPTKLCVYVNMGKLPTNLRFTHIVCSEGVSALSIPRGDGIVGVFNGEKHAVRVIIRSSFVSQRVAKYAFHVAFNTKFFLGAGVLFIFMITGVAGWNTLSKIKAKTE